MQKKTIALEARLIDSANSIIHIDGCSSGNWGQLFKHFFISSTNKLFSKNLFVFSDDDKALKFFNTIKHSHRCLFYPGIGDDIYSSITPSEFDLTKRFTACSAILNSDGEENSKLSIVTSISALNLYIPPHKFFTENNFILNISDIIPHQELSQYLVSVGYSRTPTTEEPGTFSVKGEIFDIYPPYGDPVRIQYFDDMIESIFVIDRNTLLTQKDKALSAFIIKPTQHCLLKKININCFRGKFPRPNLAQKELFSYRETILKKLSDGQFFNDYPLYISYFHEELSTLFDIVKDFNICFFDKFNITQTLDLLKSSMEEECDNFIDNTIDQIKPSPIEIYNFDFVYPSDSTFINELNIQNDFDDTSKNTLSIGIKNLTQCFSDNSLIGTKKHEKLCNLINLFLLKNNSVNIFYTSDKSLSEIKYILSHFKGEQYLNNINFVMNELESSFFYEIEKILFISENDFFEKKIKKVKSQQKFSENDIFAEQLSTLELNDYVIHKDHGIGQYKGIQTLEISGSISDFIVLEYQDKDKVYVPVHKLFLLQKHSNRVASITLASLKSKKFDTAKNRAKGSVKKLAFDLLELHAKRKLQKGFAFSEPDHLFNEFSLSFKYQETPDQTLAIENVIDDMVSDRPMDRLVCGDVGFGKTEVAMRAAFKAVVDHKQVGVLVPTTVLALQHYYTFKERFKDVPVEIDFISRFKTTKETNIILKKLSEGKIDILIGTHKLLSDKVKFSDLGLLVIDEEQRFGVAHKEKLKIMREAVDTLTLTATPIPRTLQMSFLGIKELSVIKTPPPRRQTIKSYVIKEDLQTLKLAIEKELKRGGQIFIVHNKVQDIEIYTSKIRQIVPKARIIFAHGQLPERELEKRISDFYSYKYDILVSTTIIESGIDIPRANTMIIDRADTYGLSQLHQLRGRIGRSEKKAYAYFIIPSHKTLTEVASKRLKALQTYTDLGSGLNLATSDLELRGSGDILGAEQSGHIGDIGLELYMDLLKEAINELKGKQITSVKPVEIVTQFPSYIPNTYINNTGVRLKFYKQISNSNSTDTLETIKINITDQYGKAPPEVLNLFSIIQCRNLLTALALTSIKVKSSTVVLTFDKNLLTNDDSLRSKILDFFMLRPKIYKINPDYSIICHFKDKILLSTLVEFSENLAENLK